MMNPNMKNSIRSIDLIEKLTNLKKSVDRYTEETKLGKKKATLATVGNNFSITFNNKSLCNSTQKSTKANFKKIEPPVIYSDRK